MTPEESYNAALGIEPAAAELVPAPEPAAEPASAPIDAATAPEAPAAPKINPSWEEAWQDVPEPIRELQRPYFEKWDANYQALNARHAPYEAYEKKGYNPEYISQAIEIQKALSEDPEGFVQQVAEHFGITFAQAAAAVDATQQGAEETFLTPEEQRIRAVELRQQQIDENIRQRQEAEENYRIQQEQVGRITTELAGLHARYGDFDENRIVQQAMVNAQRGGNASLEVALNEVRAWEAEVLQRAARTAPKVLGAAGGTGAFQTPPEPKKILSNDELLAKALAMGQQLTQGS